VSSQRKSWIGPCAEQLKDKLSFPIHFMRQLLEENCA